MRARQAVCSLAGITLLAACSVVGDYEVHLESGNQPSGFLTRPMNFTASSDASVQDVAQRICTGVKPGSVAQVVFVGKVPGPGPVDISDWGKYRYDCLATAGVAPPPAPVPVAAPAAAPAAMPGAPPAAATTPPAAPPGAAAPAQGLGETQEQHRRECQRRQGTYQVCVGSCLASSSSASGVVEAECAQRCAPQFPAGCN